MPISGASRNRPASRRSRRGDARKRRTGGAGQNPQLRVPFIRRNIPTYDLLDEESFVEIEAATDRILAEIGIEFREDPETVRLFREAGGNVTELSAEAWNIKFEPGLVRNILRTAPTSYPARAQSS